MSLLRCKLECLLRTITMMVTSTMATTTTTTTHSAMMIVVIGICEPVESEGGMVTVVMAFVTVVMVFVTLAVDTREDTAEHNMCDITPNTEREQLELAHLDQCLH